METVFDYDITPEEVKSIGLPDKEFYLKFATEEDAYQDLAHLYYLRGDKKRAKKYADKLPPQDKNDFWRCVTHP